MDSASAAFADGGSWEAKVDDFMSKIGADVATLKASRDATMAAPSFDPSVPPPPPTTSSMGMPPEHTHSGGSGYADMSYASYNSTSGVGGLPDHYTSSNGYPAGLDLPPPVTISSDPHLLNTSQTESSEYMSVDSPQVHNGLMPAADERASAEKEPAKPMTAKEKKLHDTMQKEIWQYVADKVLLDPYFLKRRKKKAENADDEDLKVWFFLERIFSMSGISV